MELFIYLGKAGAGMIALYVVYWLWLRKHTYFAFNRFYLLTALLISLGAPFIVLPEKAPEPLPMAEFVMEPTTIVFQPEAAPLISTEEVLLLVYVLGALFMLVRLGVRLWQIRQTIRSGERLRSGKYILVRASNENVSSFSFLNYLVLSQKDVEPYGEVVLRHELVHIRQRHSWDLLWVEFVHVFMWFNPALIFYKRSLKEVHEFIADEQATNGDRFTYARTLAGYAFGVSPQVLTNNFFDVSQLKNRIAMLTKNRSSRWVLGRYLLALPVVVGLVSLVAARSYEVIDEQPLENIVEAKGSILVKGKVVSKKDNQPLPGVSISINGAQRGTSTDFNGDFIFSNVPSGAELLVDFIGFKTKIVPINGKANTTQVVKIALEPGPSLPTEANYKKVINPTPIIIDGEEVLNVVEKNPEFPGGLRALQQYLQTNLKYPEPARRAQVGGKVFISFVVKKDGSISNVGVIKGLGFGCDEEAVRVTTAMPQWKPGMQKGKTVNVKYNLPIAFVLEKNSSTSSNGEKSPEFPGGMPALQQFIASNLKFPEAARRANVEGIVITGFTVTKEGAIKDVVIVKGIGFGCDAEALKLVMKMPKWTPATQNGEPVDAKYNLPISFDNTPLIKFSQSKNGETIGVLNNGKVIQEKNLGGNQYSTFSTGTAPGKEPLYILDGKEISNSDLNGKINPEDIDNISILKDESAIKIYGEKAKNGVILITSKKAGNQLNEVVVVGKPKTNDDPISNALWILDGKEMAKDQIQKLSPDTIESMNVLKGEEATKKYGDKGKKGVIEITTKKN